MSNSIIDSIQATETAEAFGEFLDQHPQVTDILIRDLVDIDDDYTHPLPAQHRLGDIAMHRSNSQASNIIAADIVASVVAKTHINSIGDAFGHEDREPFQTP